MKSLKIIFISFIISTTLCEWVCFASPTLVSVSKSVDPEIVRQEQELNRLAGKMIQGASNYPETGSTSYEDKFVRRFVSILSDNRTFGYDFPLLKKHDINLLISDDKRLKIYSWQSPYSGSMWHTQNLLQYIDDNHKTIAVSFNNLYKQKDNGTSPSPVLDKIYRVGNKTVVLYLLTGYGQMSGTEPYSVAHLLNIAAHKFNINKKLFVINNRPDNEIYVSVNVGGDQDIDVIRNKLAIRYDVTNQKVTYPLTKEIDNNVVLTGKTRQLLFKNGVFK